MPKALLLFILAETREHSSLSKKCRSGKGLAVSQLSELHTNTLLLLNLYPC